MTTGNRPKMKPARVQQGTTAVADSRNDGPAVANRLAALAGEILRLCGEARRLTSDAIDQDREAGKKCLKAKAACKDADVPWEPWCEEHLKAIGGLRTVQRLMKLAKNWKLIKGERKKTPDLTTKAALRLLATARKKLRERAAEAELEPQERSAERQPAERKEDQVPRLKVSRSRAEKVAAAMELDPRVAIDYLRLMVGTLGFIMDVEDD